MKITLKNNPKKHPLKRDRTEALLRFLAKQLLEQTPALEWGELTVVVMGDVEIKEINRAYLDRDRPTDVISFRYDPIPGEGGRYSGDVLANYEMAQREGLRRAGGPDRELALYIAHGIDHLSGADDDTPAKRDSMRRRECAWLDRAERKNLIQNIYPDQS